MSKLTTGQIYAYARDAGFNAGEAVTATAIALAESGGDTDVIGDRDLEDAKWGPSVGLWQIRTLKAETGKGTIRDINWLRGSAVHQAKAAFQLRKDKRGWNNWSVYKNDKYKSKVDGVEAVVDRQAATDESWWVKLLLGSNTIGGQFIGNLQGGDDTEEAASRTATDIPGSAELEEEVQNGAWAQLKRLLETLNSAEFWKRFGVGAAGGLLLVLGVIILVVSFKDKIVKSTVGAAVGGIAKGGA